MAHAGKVLRVALTHGKRATVRQPIFGQAERNPFVKPDDLLYIIKQTYESLP